MGKDPNSWMVFVSENIPLKNDDFLGPEIATETSVTWTKTGPANALYRWFKGRPRHALFIITICSG